MWLATLHELFCKFIGEYNSERILKIGQHLYSGSLLTFCVDIQRYGTSR